MDSNKTPSEIIAELCVEAGISKSELARRLEITPSQITRILNGDTKTISSDILIKLTKLFGVSADYLLGITDKKEIENHIKHIIFDERNNKRKAYNTSTNVTYEFGISTRKVHRIYRKYR